MAVFILSINLVNALNNYYDFNLVYNKGNLSYNSLNVRPLTKEVLTNNYEGKYLLKLISLNNKLLYSIYFNINLEIIYDSIGFREDPNHGVLFLDTTIINFKIPYYENAGEMIIYGNDSNELLKIDVSAYSKQKCGNNLCDFSENYNNCKLDCKSGLKDNYCDKIKDNKCDPDCKLNLDQDCLDKGKIKKENLNKSVYYTFGVLFLIILILTILFLIIKKKR